MRLVMVHGIGRTPRDFAAGLERNLVGVGLPVEAVPVWWEPYTPGVRWLPLPLELILDLWLSVSWLWRRRREVILAEIQAAVGDGHCVLVAHSHGVWLAIQALRRGPTVALFVSLDRAVHRLGGLHFPGHHEVRFQQWVNVYSTVLGARVPVEHFRDVCPVIVNVPIHPDELPHTDYWGSARVAEIVAAHWPGEAAA